MSAFCPESSDFNPRSREGSDRRSLREHDGVHISIHAPVKGATIRAIQTARIPDISIHAPVKGATPLPIILSATRMNFNPRSHEGSDLTVCLCR